MILGVIITYNPELKRLQNNINSIVEQVNNILIIDNNSSNIKEIENKFINKKIKILKNKENIGIASALNKGLNYAQKNKYNYILTLDQDSISTNNMVKELRNGFRKEKNIGIVSPSVFDLNVKKYMTKKIEHRYEEVEWSITSGGLCKVKSLLKVNGFDEILFIDCVDLDICLKLKKIGEKIVLSKFATLEHEVGKMKIKKFCGIKFNVTNHSSFRVYYIFRNNLYINHCYKNNGLKGKLKLIKKFWGIMFYEKDKYEKIKSIKNAIFDYKQMIHYKKLETKI